MNTNSSQIKKIMNNTYMATQQGVSYYENYNILLV